MESPGFNGMWRHLLQSTASFIRLIHDFFQNKAATAKNSVCHSYVCRRGQCVVEQPNLTKRPLFCRSVQFGQMQELTNDKYSDVRLYRIFHIQYKDIEIVTNKTEPRITCPICHLQGLPRYRFNMANDRVQLSSVTYFNLAFLEMLCVLVEIFEFLESPMSRNSPSLSDCYHPMVVFATSMNVRLHLV